MTPKSWKDILTPETPDGDCFIAIDFETADQYPDSACAVALIKVKGLQVVDRISFLIRPPRPQVRFTEIHGITWRHVADKPDFAGHWPTIATFVPDARFFVAHNAPFDRRVWQACCERAGVRPPDLPFFCTVQLSRRTWTLPSNSLPNVCRHLGISLNHHNAESDALACASIVIAARRSVAPLIWVCGDQPGPS